MPYRPDGTVHTNQAGEFNRSPVKAVPVSADTILLEDSADGTKKKRTTLSALPVAAHTHTHASTTGQTADDHHAELHTVASHSDTTATGAQLNTLVGAGNADALHSHAHAATTGQTANDHHAKLHAAGHSDGGADEVTVENLATAGAAGTVVTSDGVGGLTMSAPAGGTPSGPAGGDLTGTYPNPTIAANAVDNTKAANMAAYTVKLRNAGSTGDPGDVKVSALTEEATPTTGDWVLGEESGGELRKYDVDNLRRDDTITWQINGQQPPINTAQDGHRPVRTSGTIMGVIFAVKARGKSGANNRVDIHKHVPTKPITTLRVGTSGTTIYTTQANRPTIAGNDATDTDNAIIQATASDVTTFAAGDFFTCDVDDSANNSEDFTVTMYVRYDD